MQREHSRPFLFIAFAERMVFKRADSSARAFSDLHATAHVTNHTAVHV